MTFPWKKAKSTRFSRLVAAFHQPPKRGRSLVVETGFPTSLVDLIVKNRNRLRKSPKRESRPQIQTPPTHPPSSPPPCNEKVQSPQMDVGRSVLVQRECAGRIAFYAAFKVIIVVALAVSTRKLALWIMMAAFLLLLIEFVGASVFGFLLPESQTFSLDSWIRKGLFVLMKWDWDQTPLAEELIAKQQATVLPDSCDCVEEIQIAESEFDCVGTVQGCEILDQTRIIVDEMEIRRKKSEHSRSGRIKRHLIKKLVPKKFRHGKKKGESDKKDQLGADIHKMEEIEEEEEEEKNTSTGEEKGENVRKERGSGNRVSMIVIVLAGLLVGGRAVALLLTLVCCLMIRYIGRLRCLNDISDKTR